VTRNAAEADWIRTAGRIVPDAVPHLLAEDRGRGLFVMNFFDPAAFPVWKSELRDGRISSDAGASVGAVLGLIHAETAGRPDIAEGFANDDLFHGIRLSPYLRTTAQAHPDLAGRLQELAEITAGTKRALVHGDVSPKNILIGPKGPVFLDAECAWYGDPAFDIAFCLNHLLLKCIWRPQWTEDYLHVFAALAAAYLARVTWESPAELEARAAALLPGLMLARIDGTSPVEYITETSDRDRVRRAARAALSPTGNTLAGVCRIYREEADL
jgi:aminoglycoside phosphotransferase (APT) family kinase protein